MDLRKEQILKHISQLVEIKKLYDCQFKCLTAITYLIKKDMLSAEALEDIFDKTKSCQHLSVREFVNPVLPEIATYCLCNDFVDKIHKIEATYSITAFDMTKNPPEKK